MKRIAALIVVSLSSAFALASCGSHERSRILDDVASYIQERPDSALVILSEAKCLFDVNELANAKGFHIPRSQQARYWLLYATAIDKCYIDTTDVSIIDPAVAYYSRHGSPDEKLKAFYYQGRIYYNAGNYPDAIVSYSKAAEAESKVTDMRYLGLLHQAMANTYSNSYIFDEAVRHSEIAYHLFHEGGFTRLANSSLFRKAQELTNKGLRTEADSIYLSLISEDISSDMLSQIYCGLALNSIVSDNPDYQSALEYYNSALDIRGTLGKYNHWGAYAFVLAVNGESEKSDSIFRQLSSLKGDDAVYYYSWMATLDSHFNRNNTAYENFKASMGKQNEILRKNLEQSTALAQRDYQEMRKLHEQKRRIVQSASFALVLITILFIGTMAYYRRWKKNRIISEERDALARLNEEVKLQLALLEETSFDLHDRLERVQAEYAKVYKKQFSTIGRLCETVLVADRHSRPDQYLSTEIRKMAGEIRNDDRGHKRLESLLNKSFDNVMLHFRSDFPDLSDEEYEYASYVFANFQGSTICFLTGIPSQNAVYTRKTRLKEVIAKSEATHKNQYLSLM